MFCVCGYKYMSTYYSMCVMVIGQLAVELILTLQQVILGMGFSL